MANQHQVRRDFPEPWLSESPVTEVADQFPNVYICMDGRNDGSVPQELIVRRTVDGEAVARVAALEGEQWNAPFSVGGGIIIATTHVPGDSEWAPRLYRIKIADVEKADPVVEQVPFPPIRSGRVCATALSPDGSLAVLVVDAGRTFRDEYLICVPLRNAGPLRIWPLADPTSHVSHISVGSDGDIVLLQTGSPGRSQHRRILRCRLDDDTLPCGTVVSEDGLHGIYQAMTVEVSPAGLLAVAHTSNGGTDFTVTLVPMDGGPERVLLRRPCTPAHDTPVLSFDAAGKHLLVSYGDLLAVAITDAAQRPVAGPPDADHWRLAAW